MWKITIFTLLRGGWALTQSPLGTGRKSVAGELSNGLSAVSFSNFFILISFHSSCILWVVFYLYKYSTFIIEKLKIQINRKKIKENVAITLPSPIQ